MPGIYLVVTAIPDDPRAVSMSSWQTFAQNISSASDAELADWQERGLAGRRRGGNVLVWGVLAAAGVIALTQSPERTPARSDPETVLSFAFCGRSLRGDEAVPSLAR
jgi:hypothetical protein